MPAAAVVRTLRLESIIFLLLKAAQRLGIRPSSPIALLYSCNRGSMSFPVLTNLSDI
jgi:hypothetical protein